MPAALPLHSRGLYEVLPLPPLSLEKFVIILCNQFSLYSQHIDYVPAGEQQGNNDVDEAGKERPQHERGEETTEHNEHSQPTFPQVTSDLRGLG